MITHWLSDSVTLITSRASCDAKNIFHWHQCNKKDRGSIGKPVWDEGRCLVGYNHRDQLSTSWTTVPCPNNPTPNHRRFPPSHPPPSSQSTGNYHDIQIPASCIVLIPITLEILLSFRCSPWKASWIRCSGRLKGFFLHKYDTS